MLVCSPSLCRSLSDSRHPGGKKKVETLQTDVLNMKHLAQELEAALNTMKAQYARRVDRNI